MSEKLSIRNWERWQSYRRDRGQPPWIKVHRCLMRDLEWVALSDTRRGQLVAIWLLAADHDGVIPASPDLIQKLCFMSDKPDIESFINQGFIERGVSAASERRQDDANMSHQNRDRDRIETETETEAEKISRKRAIPKDFAISDQVRDWAKRNGHAHLEERFEAFVDAAKAKGYRYKDWDAAFKTAVRDDWAKLSKPKADLDHVPAIFRSVM